MSAQRKVLEEAIALVESKPKFVGKERMVQAFQAALEAIQFSKEMEDEPLPQSVEQRVEDLKFLEGLFDVDEFNAKSILTRNLKALNDEANVAVLALNYPSMWDCVRAIYARMVDPNLEEKKRKVLGSYPTPTGQKTRMTPEEQLRVRSVTFRSWFGDWVSAAKTGNYNGVSKLVDEATKEPMVLFHGTGLKSSPFTIFKTTVTQTPGIYFSDDKEYAQWFADNDANRTDRAAGGSMPYIYSCYVRMMNPLDLRGLGLEKLKGQDVLDVIYVTTGYEVQDDSILKYGDREAFIWVWMRKVPSLIQEIRQMTEFDGILFEAFNPSFLKDPSQGTPKLGLEVLAFYPNQVKLTDALLYTGLVDDVRFESGGKIES